MTLYQFAVKHLKKNYNADIDKSTSEFFAAFELFKKNNSDTEIQEDIITFLRDYYSLFSNFFFISDSNQINTFSMINFLKQLMSHNGQLHTTVSGLLFLQDFINVIYKKEEVNFRKYDYILEGIDRRSVENITKKIELELPKNTEVGTLTLSKEVEILLSVTGIEGLLKATELFIKLPISK